MIAILIKKNYPQRDHSVYISVISEDQNRSINCKIQANPALLTDPP